MNTKQAFKKYLFDNFSLQNLKAPLFNNNIALRFDLQEVEPDNEHYFNIVVKRATSLIEEVIDPNDELFLIYGVYKWRRRKIRLGNYLFKQIKDFDNNDVEYYTAKDLYEKDDAYDIAVLKLMFNRINYKNILTAIANTDFPPRKPRFGFLSDTNIFFVNVSKNLVFHMYDDRGLDITSSDIETLKPIYKKFNSWILEANREKIDSLFK